MSKHIKDRELSQMAEGYGQRCETPEDEKSYASGLVAAGQSNRIVAGLLMRLIDMQQAHSESLERLVSLIAIQQAQSGLLTRIAKSQEDQGHAATVMCEKLARLREDQADTYTTQMFT